MTLVDQGLAQGIREIFGLTYGHTYTRIPRTQGARNVAAETPFTSGPPQPDRPCTYVDRTDVGVTDGGFITRQVPPVQTSSVYRDVLFLPHDDDLVKDDLVENVRSIQDDRVLLVGPVPVIDVQDQAGFGPVTARVAILRGPIEEAVRQ